MRMLCGVPSIVALLLQFGASGSYMDFSGAGFQLIWAILQVHWVFQVLGAFECLLHFMRLLRGFSSIVALLLQLPVVLGGL